MNSDEGLLCGAEAWVEAGAARQIPEDESDEMIPVISGSRHPAPGIRLWSLDLGSGPHPAEGYVGVDTCESDSDEMVIHHDLCSGEPWPFNDESVERMRAWHVIEHIPHDRIRIGTMNATIWKKLPGRDPVRSRRDIEVTQNAFFWFFDQAFRIAAPGCIFELAWPHPSHAMAEQDPTHTRYVPEAMLNYLSREGRRALCVTQYPVACDWRIVEINRMTTPEAICALKTTVGTGADPNHHRNVYHEIRCKLVKPMR